MNSLSRPLFKAHNRDAKNWLPDYIGAETVRW
jgi:hypothetical protein